jgi:TPP-dependent pyruvate/acetoin dehydrogenase alpha subunit
MSLHPDVQLERFKKLVTIRNVELVLAREAEARSFQTPIHLAIGQEATAIGISENLSIDDSVYGNHRSHAHYLSLGGCVFSLFAEILGKAEGCSGGRGGSMHLSNPEIGFIGSMPIVGGTIPIAAGAALSHKVKSDQGIAVVYFGDGAVEEGVFHETLNLATSMQLPILFVCENNLMSSHLHVSQRQTQSDMSRFAAAHGMENLRIDGNDIDDVSKKTKGIISKIRENHEPFFIEAMTYRLYGHVGYEIDEEVGLNRKSDLAKWIDKDPLRTFRDFLINDGLANEDFLSDLEKLILSEIEEDWTRALNANYPVSETLLNHVYFEASK